MRRLLPALTIALGALTLTAQKSLPLPSIPSTLTAPHERAAYALAHWWDSLPFADKAAVEAAVADSSLEQSFVDFITIAPIAAPQERDTAVAALLRSASVNTQAFSTIVELADKYLYDYDSPSRNEELMATFISHLPESPAADELMLQRYEAVMDDIRLNAPGTPAASFELTVASTGAVTTLAELVGAASDSVMLFFYDPDCESCGEAMEKLGADPGMAVIAVNMAPGNTRSHPLPAGWTDVIPREPIEEEGLYSIPRTPFILIVTPSLTVIHKDYRPTP